MIKPDFSLTGKVAIVTGAAKGGIGEAYAEALAGAGASVVCADIDLPRANDVAAGVTGASGAAIAVEADISSEDSVNAMVADTITEFGGVDILVNNAALMAQIVLNSPTNFSREEWDRAFGVNVTGAWQCAKAVAPSMKQRGGGRIVNQSSAGAFPAETVYGITKLAIVGLTTALAKELGTYNITVNCIAPGMTQSVAGKMLTPPDGEFRQQIEARAAMRATGDPDELCGTLLLFCSPAGAWITGQVLNVDGGWVMGP
ncbi:MAG TPA: SDR family oxidoreductase [Acidimicrobiales bacterium]|jgi:NAD(P)-dependent dehydrogenase (short-subunit alcohol dehydrogenase family)